jgi:transposase
MCELVVERIEVTAEEIDAAFERLEAACPPDLAAELALIKKVVQSFLDVSRLLEKEKMTIAALRKLIFGPKSEKLRNLFPDAGGDQPEGASSSSPGAESSAGAESPESIPEPEPKPEPKPKPKPKGHGRNGAEEYTGAETNEISHPSLSPGDPCPESGCEGKVYEFQPLVLVRVRGQAPLGATVHRIQQLRCNLCLKIFPACSPKEFGAEKYDASAATMMAILTYGTGVPFYRLGNLQANLGIPLPPSTQWDVVNGAAKLVAPVYRALIDEAAQGDVLHNDDTPMKILEYMAKKEEKRDVG